MAVENQSAATAYATKPNIKHPGTAADVTAALAAAKARMDDEFGQTGVTTTVPAGAIVKANP